MLVKASAINRIEVILIACHERRSIAVVHHPENVVIQRIGVVKCDVLDVTHSAVVQLRTEVLHA